MPAVRLWKMCARKDCDFIIDQSYSNILVALLVETSGHDTGFSDTGY